ERPIVAFDAAASTPPLMRSAEDACGSRPASLHRGLVALLEKLDHGKLLGSRTPSRAAVRPGARRAVCRGPVACVARRHFGYGVGKVAADALLAGLAPPT